MYRHYGPLHVYPIFSGIGHGWRLKGQWKTKKVFGFFFSHTFLHLSGLNLMWCSSSLNWTSWYYSSVRSVYCSKKKKKVNEGMHSGIHELISPMLSMMIDSTALDMFILVWLTLTLTESFRSVKKQQLLCQLSQKVLRRFWRNLVCCWDLFFWRSSFSI